MNEGRKLTEDDVMNLASDMPREVQPGRDLWPGIEAAIGSEASPAVSGRRTRWFAQAAAVLLLVGASSGLTWLTLGGEGGMDPSATGPANLVFEPVSGSFGSEYSLGPDFQDARNSLASKLDEELERLPPETREEVEKNMATIRAAIAEINKALAEEPDNVLLQELLISSYGEELKVMRKVDRIANSVMHRTDI